MILEVLHLQNNNIQTNKMLEKLKNILRKQLLKKAKGIVDLESDESYLSKKNIKYEYFQEEEKIIGLKPVLLSPCEDKALTSFDSFLKGYFLDIQNSKFRFTNNHLLDDEQNVIYHLGFSFDKLPIKNQLLPRKSQYLEGTIAYLSNTASNHFGHWLRHILPILYIYQKYSDLDEINYFYLGDFEKPAHFIYETFEILDIPKEKLIHYPCHSKRMLSIVSSWEIKLNQKNSYFPKPYFDFIRKSFLDKITKQKNYPEKIYIQRGNVTWRFVQNEAEIIKILLDKGFKVLSMDNLPLVEQINYFQQAKIIIAPHGSALTNLIFCSKNCKVVELMPYNYQDNTSFQYAFLAKAQYYYMRGLKIATDKEAPYEDILVDLDLLKNVIKNF